MARQGSHPQQKTKRQKLNLTFVDMAKVFHSVSHHSIITDVRRLDTPPVLTTYLKSLKFLQSSDENGEGTQWGGTSW